MQSRHMLHVLLSLSIFMHFAALYGSKSSAAANVCEILNCFIQKRFTFAAIISHIKLHNIQSMNNSPTKPLGLPTFIFTNQREKKPPAICHSTESLRI